MWFVPIGQHKKISWKAGVCLVSVLAVGDSVLFHGFCCCFLFGVLDTLVCLADVSMVLFSLFVSGLLTFVATDLKHQLVA